MSEVQLELPFEPERRWTYERILPREWTAEEIQAVMGGHFVTVRTISLAEAKRIYGVDDSND